MSLGGVALGLVVGGAWSIVRRPGTFVTRAPVAQAAEPMCSPLVPLAGVGVGPGVGQQAPDFTLPNLSGAPVRLSSFRGCPVVLDFWASWCKPCQASLPKLEALRQKYKAWGLKVVAVSLDHRLDDAARFLETNGYREFVSLWAPFSEARAVANLFGVQAIPRTVFLDRQGIIRFSGHPQDLTEEVIALWL